MRHRTMHFQPIRLSTEAIRSSREARRAMMRASQSAIQVSSLLSKEVLSVGDGNGSNALPAAALLPNKRMPQNTHSCFDLSRRDSSLKVSLRGHAPGANANRHKEASANLTSCAQHTAARGYNNWRFKPQPEDTTGVLTYPIAAAVRIININLNDARG